MTEKKLTRVELDERLERIRAAARDRRSNDKSPKWLCPRMGRPVRMQVCQECKSDRNTRVMYRSQAEQRMIPWWNYHCPYEVEMGPVPHVSVEDSIRNNHWRDLDDEVQKDHLENLQGRISLMAQGHLLSSRLAHNLGYWMREAVNHAGFLEAHISTEAGKHHLERVQKFLGMLRNEMKMWETLQAGADHAGVRLGGAPRAETERCIFSGEIIGKTSQSCCGGKVKEVDEWSCLAKGRTTGKACLKCSSYLPQANMNVSYPVDLLVGSKVCEDCKTLEMDISSLSGKTRELQVFNLKTDEQLREFLDARMSRSDLYGPALFTEMQLQTGKYGWSTDDPDEIREYLRGEGYIRDA